MIRKSIYTFKKNEDGAVVIIIALIMTVLIGFSALVLDVGLAYNKKAELQKDLDSIALAAVRELPADSTTSDEWSKAVDAAIKYAQMNGIPDLNDALDGIENIQPRRFVESDLTSKIIGVTIVDTVDVNYNFASIMGFKSSKIKSNATAKLEAASTIKGLLPLALPYEIFEYLNGSKTDAEGNPITGNMTLKLGPQKDSVLDPTDVRSEFSDIFEQLFLEATGKGDVDNSDENGNTNGNTSTGGWRGAINFSEHGNLGNYQKAMRAGGFQGEIKIGEEVTLNNGTMTINNSPITEGIYAVPVIKYEDGALKIVDICSIEITDILSDNNNGNGNGNNNGNNNGIKIIVANNYTGAHVVPGTVFGVKKNSNNVVVAKLVDYPID